MGFLLLYTFSYLSWSNLLPLLVYTLLSLMLPFLNYIGLHQVSRLMISLIPLVVVFAYDINSKLNASNPEVLGYVAPRFVILSSITLPLALFDAKERVLMYMSAILILLGVFGFDEVYRFFGAHFSQSGLSSHSYRLIGLNSFIIAVIILSTFSFLIANNYSGQRQIEQLLQDAEDKNNMLRANQEELTRSLEAIHQNQLVEKQRNWHSEGLADFAQLMRQHRVGHELYPRLLSKLVNHLTSYQGGLYILSQEFYEEESEKVPVLELAAGYGLSKEGLFQKKILVGDGLVGEAFSRKKMLHLKKVPKDYHEIPLGMGVARPQQVLLVPLIAYESCLGIIEINTLGAFEPHHIHFMTQVSEAIASTVQNIQIYQQNFRG